MENYQLKEVRSTSFNKRLLRNLCHYEVKSTSVWWNKTVKYEDIKILILEPKKERPTRGRDTDFGYIEDLRGEDGYNMNIAKELFKEYF